MKKLGGRDVRVFFILSVVAPISLLAAFRVTGVISGSSIPEYLRVDTVNWVRKDQRAMHFSTTL